MLYSTTIYSLSSVLSFHNLGLFIFSIFCILYCAELSRKDIILTNFPFFIQTFYYYFSFDLKPNKTKCNTSLLAGVLFFFWQHYFRDEKSVVSESFKPPITTLLLTFLLTFFLALFLTYLSLMDEPLPGIPSEFWQKALPPCSSAGWYSRGNRSSRKCCRRTWNAKWHHVNRCFR